MGHQNLYRGVILFVALLLIGSGGLVGQASGNVYVLITDSDGSPLPGVTVVLSGVGAPKTQITEAQGAASFLGLDPGKYQVCGTREGFGSVEYPNVTVTVGRNTSVVLELEPSVKDVITVTSARTIIDEGSHLRSSDLGPFRGDGEGVVSSPGLG